MKDIIIHKPVLLEESILSLNIKPEGCYIDGTFGQGGHARYILSKLNNNGLILGIDRDIDAINLSKNIKDPRFLMIHGLFSNIERYSESLNLLGRVDGILLDLGVSTMQLDNSERGFSFMKDGPLDMRMNYTEGKTASQWISSASEKEIRDVLMNFGEERYSKKIARSLYKIKSKSSITRTFELKKIILNSMPIKYKNKHHYIKHLVTRSFQAIRIYINNELEEIRNFLSSSLKVLRSGGRCVIISFHSLEDRIIKNFIRNNSYKKSHISIYNQYITNNNVKILSDKKENNGFLLEEKNRFVLVKGKLRSSLQEKKLNPRSRSAILRCFEKI